MTQRGAVAETGGEWAVVGRVQSIWRYPVKSMGGEELEACRIGAAGLPGDRGFALRDEKRGEIRGAKKFPALMQCSARYRREPSDTEIPPVDIELPDGEATASDDGGIAGQLSALLGTPVTLWPRQPAEDLDHYRRAAPEDLGKEAELRAIFGREPGEPLPDLSVFPRELFEFTSPRGTYFDAFPIHLLTTSWLEYLRGHNRDAIFDARRFRPNFVIESEASGRAELDWTGAVIRLGGAELRCEMPTVRCSMTIQPTGDLPKDPSVLRTIVGASDQNVGAYASVQRPGAVRIGDPVELLVRGVPTPMQ